MEPRFARSVLGRLGRRSRALTPRERHRRPGKAPRLGHRRRSRSVLIVYSDERLQLELPFLVSFDQSQARQIRALAPSDPIPNRLRQSREVLLYLHLRRGVEGAPLCAAACWGNIEVVIALLGGRHPRPRRPARHRPRPMNPHRPSTEADVAVDGTGLHGVTLLLPPGVAMSPGAVTPVRQTGQAGPHHHLWQHTARCTRRPRRAARRTPTPTPSGSWTPGGRSWSAPSSVPAWGPSSTRLW
jgi:hypothetical protein